MDCKLLNTATDLKNFINGITGLNQNVRLFIDLEGNNLSRHGTLSLITVLLHPQETAYKTIYLIDVTTLKKSAFETATADGTTLKDILESKSIIKVFFDIRNDSDALFSLYNVKVAGIEDLQLMELASRNFSKRHINGLAKCIERDAQIGYYEKSQWRKVKDKGRTLFAPECGGSYSVFDQRPLAAEMERYCCQDVTLMPHLYDLYKEKLCDAWWAKVKDQTERRIRESQQPSYNGKGPDRALAPVEWLTWRPTFAERQSRSFLDEKSAARRSCLQSKDTASSTRGVAVAALEKRLEAVGLGSDAKD